MPYTAKQRRYFHAQAAKGKPGMKKLAEEADSSARQGKEKKPVKQSDRKAIKATTPVKKAVAKKVGQAKKENPGMAARAIAKQRSTDKSVTPGSAAKKVAQTYRKKK